jgi:hypothetical protein
MDQQRKNLRSTKHLVAISEGDGARELTQPTHQKQKVLQPDADGWITPKIRRKPKPHPTELQLPAATAPLPSPCDVDDLDDSKPPREPATHLALASIVDITNATGKSYSDLTGRFPNRSDTGNLYVLVFYSYDDNAILVEALRSRSDGDQLAAYQRIIERANKGATLRTHWMGNEALKAIKQLLINKGMDYQLTPPHMHRINAAERAIRTFKNHFIAGLCSAADDFPIRLWDRLLRQAEITLNLMRTSRADPQLSAQEAINGPFDFNKTPLAPPGCKVIIHEKPSQRTSWGPHGVVGWYLGPAEEHYRCYRCTSKRPKQSVSRTLSLSSRAPSNRRS